MSPSVGPSIRPSIRTSAGHAFCHNQEWIKATEGLLDLLVAPVLFYKRVCLSTGQSVHPSACQAFVNFDEN